VEPLSEYTYNAIYQVINATGRQHRGINQDTYINGFKQSIYGDLCPPDIKDETKLENYKEHYDYDEGGNLISKKHIADSFKWTDENPVADNSNRLKDSIYDAAGNPLSFKLNNSVTLNWNFRNQLSSTGIIQRPDKTDDAEYYNYNGDGLRVRKVSERYTNSGNVTEIIERIYLGNYEIKRIKTVSGPTQNILLNRENLRVMDDTTCIASLFYWLLDTSKRETNTPGKRSLRYQMNNNLGSVSLETDPDAQIISYEEYFPYGGTSIIAGRSRQEVKLKDYRYSGKECDDATGLYYYGARYYASWMGRWLNSDPAGAVDGLNVFAFVQGNPIKNIDTNGLILTDVTGVGDGGMRARINNAMPNNLPLLLEARNQLGNGGVGVERAVGRWLGKDRASQAEMTQVTQSVDRLITIYTRGNPPAKCTCCFGACIVNAVLWVVHKLFGDDPHTERFVDGTQDQQRDDTKGRALMSVSGLFTAISPISVYTDNLNRILDDNSQESSLYVSHTILHEQFHKYTGAVDTGYIDTITDRGVVAYREAEGRRERGGREDDRVHLLDVDPMSQYIDNADTLAGIVVQLGSLPGDFERFRAKFYDTSLYDKLAGVVDRVVSSAKQTLSSLWTRVTTI
jgi:RHS repeat-associated protein